MEGKQLRAQEVTNSKVEVIQMITGKRQGRNGLEADIDMMIQPDREYHSRVIYQTIP